jgi:4-amino-4-deoxy-L-arabinose transferase-like glycosyltransferase
MPVYIRYSIIFLLASVLFLPFLGQVHLFDWDEINFAECAREMLVSKDYLRVQIDYRPFWEKPPLFIWLQALSMHLFGVGEYAARFPNAVTGVVTLLCIFYAGKRVISERMGMWWALLYAATWLPHFYFKSGIIDPLFNLFIFLSFFQVHLLRYASRKALHAVLAGMFLGLAVLTKGPVAILVALLSFLVYVLVNRGLWGYRIKHLLLIAVAAFLTTCIWFGLEVINHGWWFVNEFITYQIRLFTTEDADHGGPFIYHFIVLLVGCFPASLFLFQFSRKRTTDNEPARDFTRWMWILFWVVLILFSIVRTKIVHYSSLCYFPLTYLAALQISNLADGQYRIRKGVRIGLIVIGCLLGLAIGLLPIAGMNKELLIPYVDDKFAVGNFQAAIDWSYAESLWGFLYIVGVIVAVTLMRRSFQRGMLILCAVQIVMIEATVLHFTPKIEAFSQRAAIEYFESLQGKDVYVHVLGYKSYAQHFYARKLPPANKNYYDESWLLSGPVDKPVYFISKNTEKWRYGAVPTLEVIGEKNGFVFYRRR